jgi:hypothetical protein
MNKNVAILGLGPTGAFAAKAAIDAGYQVTIYTIGDYHKFVPGPFWFHWIPEDLQQKFVPDQIYQLGKGTKSQYNSLQWGNLVTHVQQSSFPANGFVVGYNAQKVIEDLIPMTAEVVMSAGAISDVDASDIAKSYDVVFQTFPTKLSKEQQPPLVPYCMASKLSTEKRNYVVYNGTGEGVVVRECNLFGRHYLEFPKNVTRSAILHAMDMTGMDLVELKDLHPKTKPWRQPASTDPKIHLIGRWAEWQTHRLSHEIYSIVYGMLK